MSDLDRHVLRNAIVFDGTRLEAGTTATDAAKTCGQAWVLEALPLHFVRLGGAAKPAKQADTTKATTTKKKTTKKKTTSW